MKSLTINYKLKSKINKIIIPFLQRITINKLLIKLLKKAKCYERNYFQQIKKGHVISGYIPFVPYKTSIIIYNFLAINYGLRSDLKIVVGILDSKFQVLSSKIYNLSIREIFVLSQDNFVNEFKNINGEYCIACVLNQKIPINHAGHGGQLRFWGIWENFSAFSHSMPLPSPISFVRSKFNKLKNEYFERMIYPLGSSTAFHFGPLSEKIYIKERGDLSGTRKVQYGYTLLLDENKKVTSCFHNSVFSREKRFSNSNIELIEHIVPIPPLQGIDIEMFFGECSSKESLLEVKLLEYDYSIDTKTCIEKAILDLREINSIKASEIFNIKISHNRERWIVLKPISGRHDKFFISLFYSNEQYKKLFDCVHSSSFSSNPYIAKTKKNKNKLRSLKFAPFLLNQKNTFKNKEGMISFLCIIGDENKDIKARIRVFSSNSKNFELIHQKKIKKRCVHHINLNQLVDIKANEGQKGFFICQLESEEANLDSYLIHSNCESDLKNISSLAIDHLTGG